MKVDDTKKAKEENEDVCPVCLDPPLHPVSLECNHVFCFLCAKGLTENRDNLCSLCRSPISQGYLKRGNVLQRTKSELTDKGQDQLRWFYEAGQGGWWRFEKRTNEEIETARSQGLKVINLVICGNVYVIDINEKVQYRKDGSGRRRAIKNHLELNESKDVKGVAGLIVKE